MGDKRKKKKRRLLNELGFVTTDNQPRRYFQTPLSNKSYQLLQYYFIFVTDFLLTSLDDSYLCACYDVNRNASHIKRRRYIYIVNTSKRKLKSVRETPLVQRKPKTSQF